MGVPSFFRWLSHKYPQIVVDAKEEAQPSSHEEDPPMRGSNAIPVATAAAVDCTQPNVNFTEFDHLYIDMNGIIHTCTHPENEDGRWPAPQAPSTEAEMFALVFAYIDRLFAIVRPRRLLYMAIDGVAPRAKVSRARSLKCNFKQAQK